MNILIIGGAGFIGSNLCKKLILKKENIFVFDNFSKQIHQINYKNTDFYKNYNNKINIFKGDVTNSSDWKKFKNKCNEFDVVIHLASETGTGQSMYNISQYCNTNIIGITNFITYMNKFNIKTNRHILASSRAVYGNSPNNEIIASKETDELNPISIYGITKLVQEKILSLLIKNLCILRFQNIYGEGQSLKNPYTGIVSIFSNAMKNNETIEIFEDGNMIRDFIHIDDVTDALIKCIYSDITGIFNIGTGQKTTVLEIAKLLKKELKSKSKIIITHEKRIGDIRHNFADMTKTKKILNFETKISIENGIHKYIQWVNKQKEKSNYKKSLLEMRKIHILGK